MSLTVEMVRETEHQRIEQIKPGPFDDGWCRAALIARLDHPDHEHARDIKMLVAWTKSVRHKAGRYQCYV